MGGRGRGPAKLPAGAWHGRRLGGRRVGVPSGDHRAPTPLLLHTLVEQQHRVAVQVAPVCVGKCRHEPQPRSVCRARPLQVHCKHVDGGPVGRRAAGGVARLDAACPLLLGRDQALADRAVWAAVPLELRRDAPCDARAAEDVEAAERRDGTFGAHRIHANRAVPRRGGGTRSRRRGGRRSWRRFSHWRHVVRLGQIDDARGLVVSEIDGHWSDDHLSLAVVGASVFHHEACRFFSVVVVQTLPKRRVVPVHGC